MHYKMRKRHGIEIRSVKKQHVLHEAHSKGEEVHLANVIDLVHMENSQLAETFQTWKARIVEGGDTINDEINAYVIFAGQGTSDTDISQATNMDYGCQ